MEYPFIAIILRFKPLFNEFLRYDIKQSDGEAPVLELCGMWNTLSLPFLSGKNASSRNVLDTTLNNLMVRLLSWSSVECEIKFQL